MYFFSKSSINLKIFLADLFLFLKIVKDSLEQPKRLFLDL